MSTLLITLLLLLLAALILVTRFCARFSVFPLYDYDPLETDNPDEDQDNDYHD